MTLHSPSFVWCVSMCVLRVRVGSSQKKLLSVGSLQALFRARRRARDLVFVKDLTVRAAFNQPSQQNLLSVFTFVDVSGDGTISVAEFTAAIRRASMCVGMRWKWEVGGGVHVIWMLGAGYW